MRRRRDPLPMWVWWWGTLLFMLAMIALVGTATHCKLNNVPVKPGKDGWLVRGSAVPWADKPPSVCDWIPEGR